LARRTATGWRHRTDSDNGSLRPPDIQQLVIRHRNIASGAVFLGPSAADNDSHAAQPGTRIRPTATDRHTILIIEDDDVLLVRPKNPMIIDAWQVMHGFGGNIPESWG
jgi:hypothetical protein